MFSVPFCVWRVCPGAGFYGTSTDTSHSMSGSPVGIRVYGLCHFIISSWREGEVKGERVKSSYFGRGSGAVFSGLCDNFVARA